MVVTDYRFWILALVGFGFSVLANTNKRKLKIPSERLALLFLAFNFVLLLWNAAFTTRIAEIMSRGDEMSSADLSGLTTIAIIFAALAVVGIGYLVGEVVYAILLGKRIRKKEESGEIETTISSEKLKSMSKEIGEYKKMKADLDEFFDGLSGKVKEDDKSDSDGDKG